MKSRRMDPELTIGVDTLQEACWAGMAQARSLEGNNPTPETEDR